MVGRRRWAVLALLLLSPKLWAAGLAVRFPASALEVGRSVRVEISSPRLRPSLAGLDLSPWAPWLVLDQRGDVQSNPAGGQTLVVRLVPRASALGRAQLPPLSLGALYGGAQAIRIEPAREVRGGGAIDVHFSAPPAKARLRQQLIYTVSVVSRHRYLQWSAEPTELDGVLALAIPQQVARIGSGRYRHSAGWLLFPSRTGKLTLQLPALRYSIDGVTTHRFYPPPLDLEVRPLPAYLPPTLAVGRVTLQGVRRPWGVVRSGELQTRSFNLVVQGVPTRWWRPPPLVTDDNGIQLYEAAPRIQRHIDTRGLTVSYRYALPLTVSGAGWHHLSAASRLYVFDPTNGKMKALDLRVALPLSLYGWQEVVLGGLLLLLLWFAGSWSWRRVRRRYRWLRDYRLALASLAAARDLETLRRTLALVASAEAWPDNLSLRQWRQRWQCLQPESRLEPWFQSLQAGLYGGSPGHPEGLADELGQVLRRRLGYWQWPCVVRLGQGKTL